MCIRRKPPALFRVLLRRAAVSLKCPVRIEFAQQNKDNVADEYGKTDTQEYDHDMTEHLAPLLVSSRIFDNAKNGTDRIQQINDDNNKRQCGNDELDEEFDDCTKVVRVGLSRYNFDIL